MSIDDYKYVHCKRPTQVNIDLILSVSPYFGDEMLCLSFWRGDLHCSTPVSKDAAREFANSILDLIEAPDAPNPNQQAIDFTEQEFAA